MIVTVAKNLMEATGKEGLLWLREGGTGRSRPHYSHNQEAERDECWYSVFTFKNIFIYTYLSFICIGVLPVHMSVKVLYSLKLEV